MSSAAYDRFIRYFVTMQFLKGVSVSQTTIKVWADFLETSEEQIQSAVNDLGNLSNTQLLAEARAYFRP